MAGVTRDREVGLRGAGLQQEWVEQGLVPAEVEGLEARWLCQTV